MIRIKSGKGIDDIAIEYRAGPFQRWQERAQKLMDDLSLLDAEREATENFLQRQMLAARYELILKALWHHTGYEAVDEMTNKWREYGKETSLDIKIG